MRKIIGISKTLIKPLNQLFIRKNIELDYEEKD